MSIYLTGADDLRGLINHLRAIDKTTIRNLNTELKAAAEPIAADARRRASWSTRIPGAIRVGVSRSRARPGATIRVATANAPHARPYEGFGKKSFRRQVYGKAWVTQPTRPYLMPAVKAGRDGYRAAVEKAVRDAAAKHGFT
jgi:hypothetical protein